MRRHPDGRLLSYDIDIQQPTLDNRIRQNRQLLLDLAHPFALRSAAYSLYFFYLLNQQVFT